MGSAADEVPVDVSMSVEVGRSVDSDEVSVGSRRSLFDSVISSSSSIESVEEVAARVRFL